MRILATVLGILLFSNVGFAPPPTDAELLRSFEARITRPGHKPVALEIDGILAFLDAHPEFRREVADQGRIRILVPGRLTAAVQNALRDHVLQLRDSLGNTRRIQIDVVDSKVEESREKAGRQALRTPLPAEISDAQLEKWFQENSSPEVMRVPIPRGADPEELAQFQREVTEQWRSDPTTAPIPLEFVEADFGPGDEAEEAPTVHEKPKFSPFAHLGDEQRQALRESAEKAGALTFPLLPGLESEGRQALEEYLMLLRDELGIAKTIPIRLIPVTADMTPAPDAPPPVHRTFSQKLGDVFVGAVTGAPFRFFFSRYKKPTKEDVQVGVVTKGAAFTATAIQVLNDYLVKFPNAEHWGMYTALPLSAILDTYYGIYIGWWLRVIDDVHERHGSAAQYWLLYANGVFWNGLFSTIHHHAGGSDSGGVLTWKFAVGGMMLPFVSAWTSGAAYQGSQKAVGTGAWSPRFRRRFWQVKDFVMMVQSTQLQLGDFWNFFLGFMAERSMELYAWSAGAVTKPPPMILIVSKKAADTDWFRFNYYNASRLHHVSPGRLFLEPREVRRQYLTTRLDRMGDYVVLGAMRGLQGPVAWVGRTTGPTAQWAWRNFGGPVRAAGRATAWTWRRLVRPASRFAGRTAANLPLIGPPLRWMGVGQCGAMLEQFDGAFPDPIDETEPPEVTAAE